MSIFGTCTRTHTDSMDSCDKHESMKIKRNLTELMQLKQKEKKSMAIFRAGPRRIARSNVFFHISSSEPPHPPTPCCASHSSPNTPHLTLNYGTDRGAIKKAELVI